MVSPHTACFSVSHPWAEGAGSTYRAHHRPAAWNHGPGYPDSLRCPRNRIKAELHGQIPAFLPGCCRVRECAHAPAFTVQAFQIHVGTYALVDKTSGLHQTGPFSAIMFWPPNTKSWVDSPPLHWHRHTRTPAWLTGCISDHGGTCRCLWSHHWQSSLHHHRGPGQGVSDAGRAWHPHVLAYFSCHCKFRHGIAPE